VPRYNFKCKCGNAIEANVSFEKSEDGIKCSKCGGKMKRQFSPQGVNFQVRWGKPKVRAKVKKMGA